MMQGRPKGVVRFGSFSIIREGFRLTNAVVGRYCSIGPGVQFGSPEHPLDWLGTSSVFVSAYPWLGDSRHFQRAAGGLRYRRTVVGSDVWVGRGAYIKPGITIGDGAVVGAHAVVTKDVAPYSIVAGNPARHIRYRFSDDIIDRLKKIRWWDMNPRCLSGVDFKNVESALDKLEGVSADASLWVPDALVFSENIDVRLGDGQNDPGRVPSSSCD
jgi:hypothetical protein